MHASANGISPTVFERPFLLRETYLRQNNKSKEGDEYSFQSLFGCEPSNGAKRKMLPIALWQWCSRQTTNQRFCQIDERREQVLPDRIVLRFFLLSYSELNGFY